ncbi:MAG: sensor histidine kinase [Lysobacter sp.]
MEFLRALTQPMLLAGLVTWGAVALGLSVEESDRSVLLWSLALAYLVAFVTIDMVPPRWEGRLRMPLLLLQAGCALALVWLAPRGGTAPVLLVVLVAQLATAMPPRVTVPVVIALNIAFYLLLRGAGYSQPLLVATLYLGFQAFAALTAHYARTAEASRDALAMVNADLLATRALLADSARSNERLRVARELHDVAGHKLTALGLNLRLLEADPALRMRDELHTCRQLSGELLGDLRNLVAAMRHDDGLDLATALHALAAPLPKPSLQLRIDPAVRVTDPAVADAIVRTVQEALTNAARHAGAERLTVALSRDGDTLHLQIDDDGRLRGLLREGNGLAGMRERLTMLGGQLALSTGATGALRIEAEIPA